MLGLKLIHVSKGATRLSVSSLYPPYPKDLGMLWFYVEAARRPPPAARRPQWC